LSSRKTISQAAELEKEIFGPKQIEGNSNFKVGQGNQTLDDEHEPTSRAESHGGYEESPL